MVKADDEVEDDDADDDDDDADEDEIIGDSSPLFLLALVKCLSFVSSSIKC